jgi:hypothetical protein
MMTASMPKSSAARQTPATRVSPWPRNRVVRRGALDWTVTDVSYPTAERLEPASPRDYMDMASVNQAEHAARRVSQSDVLEVPTRAGFVGYGLLHLVVGWLAVQIAFGRPSDEGDQAGAFRTLADQPFGRVLLVAIVIGLVAMTVWQALLAAAGHQDRQGARRTFERLASLGRTVIYAALAWTAGRVVVGSSRSSAEQQQAATAGMLGHPAGRWLVALAGLAVLALGFGLCVYGARRMFEERLNMAKMSPSVLRVVRRLGQVGYIAKGVAFAVVGLLLLNAAVVQDAAKSRGLDAALRTVAAQPFGRFLLVVVAAGVAAFGVYCFFQARYRRMTR